ncbi:putative phosphatidate phosphatase [Dioscorea sansibarensis]
MEASPRRSLLQRMVDFDTALSLRIHSFFLFVPRPLLKALEISGDGRLWFPLLLSLLPLTPSSPLPTALLLGSLLDLLLIGLLKHLIRRPRPVYNKGMSLAFAVDQWSFPSGHSSRVLFLASFHGLSSTSINLGTSGIWDFIRGYHVESEVFFRSYVLTSCYEMTCWLARKGCVLCMWLKSSKYQSYTCPCSSSNFSL